MILGSDFCEVDEKVFEFLLFVFIGSCWVDIILGVIFCVGYESVLEFKLFVFVGSCGVGIIYRIKKK